MKMAYFDIVDEHDNSINKIASYDEVHSKGLWHRGVHCIIYTPDKQVVMQKRAPSLKYHPGEVEISVGGGVDAGETPEQAMIREIKEELGLHVAKHDLRYIGKVKSNHRTKTQISKVFLYSYAVCVPLKDLHLRMNEEESTAVLLIPETRLRRALRIHRIKNVGHISSLYAYWRQLLDAI